MEDYDTSSSLYIHSDTIAGSGNVGGSALVHKLFAWAAKWDGAYFTQIAHASSWDANGGPVLGYELEHYHAFFPLMPMLMASGAGDSFGSSPKSSFESRRSRFANFT